MLQLNKDQTDCSQPPSLDPSTAPFQMIWWRKSGRKHQVNNVSNGSHKKNQWNPIDMIHHTYIKQPCGSLKDYVLLVSIQSPRISLSDSSGSLFCRQSSSIPSMKLPSFENAAKFSNGRETLFFGIGKKMFGLKMLQTPSSSDPAC